ncbi:1,4-alpha-glucan branching protein domain-containing protein, partial [Hydrogenophaga sp.]|uniref:1,4-alpha-glucan branching protein domain-containing protein n=1 Tax=Hydrogenophaga sp. TaxID=1904254 RepID=UPI0025B8218A
WFEGLWFLEEVLRLCASAEELVCTTPGACLADWPEAEQAGRPALSSWGQGGYFEPWVNGSNDWIYPRLRRAERRMISAARRWGQAGALQRRALDQCARELLLAQASDWPFLMYTGTARDYAARRFRDLMERFDRL